jgi:hypothetical protein
MFKVEADVRLPLQVNQPGRAAMRSFHRSILSWVADNGRGVAGLQDHAENLKMTKNIDKFRNHGYDGDHQNREPDAQASETDAAAACEGPSCPEGLVLSLSKGALRPRWTQAFSIERAHATRARNERLVNPLKRNDLAKIPDFAP